MKRHGLDLWLTTCILLASVTTLGQEKHAVTTNHQKLRHRLGSHLMKTSVIIPCHYKHVRLLAPLLDLYEQQTMLPDEVVISISECAKVKPTLLNDLHNQTWKFPVKIITSENVQYAGTNRNIGCAQATGDILILQDADDIPHPQRIEIVKYFFNNYHVDHLMHGYIHLKTHNKWHTAAFATWKNLAAIPTCWSKPNRAIHHGGTNGEIALSKKVFNAVQWTDLPRGQDMEFNKMVYKKFKPTCIYVMAPLIAYREYLSSNPCHAIVYS